MWAILPDINDRAERAQRIGQLFSVVLEIHRRHGQPVLGVTDNGNVIGAAVVEGAASSAFRESVLASLGQAPQMVAALGWNGTLRAIRLGDELFRNRPPEPHIYLNLLGVDPDYQRRHAGITMLDCLRDLAALRSDIAGVYLETATPANVAYYTRAGYEVIGEIRPLGVRIWRMMQARR
jgi:ribosomal protein S18 acetylase RimI-like enzyme